jgi:hypothetical protein
MTDILAEDRPQVPFAVDEHPVCALGPCGAYPPLGVQFALGVRGGILTVVTPTAAKIASKTLVNLASRSRIRKRKELIRSPRSMSRLRACWAVHVPSGWAVTPRTWTRRVLTSMTNSTYRRLRKIVSTWKKSQARRPSA